MAGDIVRTGGWQSERLIPFRIEGLVRRACRHCSTARQQQHSRAEYQHRHSPPEVDIDPERRLDVDLRSCRPFLALDCLTSLIHFRDQQSKGFEGNFVTFGRRLGGRDQRFQGARGDRLGLAESLPGKVEGCVLR
jgi:hypothetical protein